MKYYEHLWYNTKTEEYKPAPKGLKPEPPWVYVKVGHIRTEPQGLVKGWKEKLK